MAVVISRCPNFQEFFSVISPADGEVLTYDAGIGKWENRPGGGGGSPARFVTFKADGGDVALQAGYSDFIFLPTAGTIAEWVILADAVGNIKIDVWKCAYADYPPVDADSICGGNEPEIVAADKGWDVDLSDWGSVAVLAGDCLKFHIDSCDSIRKVMLMLVVNP